MRRPGRGTRWGRWGLTGADGTSCGRRSLCSTCWPALFVAPACACPAGICVLPRARAPGMPAFEHVGTRAAWALGTPQCLCSGTLGMAAGRRACPWNPRQAPDMRDMRRRNFLERLRAQPQAAPCPRRPGAFGSCALCQIAAGGAAPPACRQRAEWRFCDRRRLRRPIDSAGAGRHRRSFEQGLARRPGALRAHARPPPPPRAPEAGPGI